MAKEIYRMMKCPYCFNVWALSRRQVDWNSTFTCPKCHKTNQGSIKTDENDVLIGMKTTNPTEVGEPK